MILNVLLLNTQPQQEIIQTHTLTSYQHMNQIHMLYISISSQFENKIDEVDLKSYYLSRGDDTIENSIISLIDIQEEYKVNKEISWNGF